MTEPIVKKQLGQIFADLRKEAKLSQEELAQRLGIHKQTLWRIEKEGSHITVNLLIKLCEITNKNLHEVLENYGMSDKERDDRKKIVSNLIEIIAVMSTDKIKCLLRVLE